MTNTAYALKSYMQTKVMTATNGVELVIMLYDGAIEFLDKAYAAIGMKKVLIKLKYVDRALAILTELDRCLNFEAGGDIAVNLHDLYFYMMKELVLANAANDGEKMKHIAGLLKNLRIGWVQIRDKV